MELGLQKMLAIYEDGEERQINNNRRAINEENKGSPNYPASEPTNIYWGPTVCWAPDIRFQGEQSRESPFSQ